MARRKNLIEELSEKHQGKPGKLHALEVDITNEQQIIQAFQIIEETIGPVNILINNAGVALKNTIIDGNTELWRQVFDVNVLGERTASVLLRGVTETVICRPDHRNKRGN